MLDRRSVPKWEPGPSFSWALPTIVVRMSNNDCDGRVLPGGRPWQPLPSHMASCKRSANRSQDSARVEAAAGDLVSLVEPAHGRSTRSPCRLATVSRSVRASPLPPALKLWTLHGATRSFDIWAPVAAGKFVEVCDRLMPGRQVAWRSGGDRRLDFNNHYYAGGGVVFPERRAAVSHAGGRLVVEREDYCWIWTSPAADRSRRSQPPKKMACVHRLSGRR